MADAEIPVEGVDDSYFTRGSTHPRGSNSTPIPLTQHIPPHVITVRLARSGRYDDDHGSCHHFCTPLQFRNSAPLSVPSSHTVQGPRVPVVYAGER